VLLQGDFDIEPCEETGETFEANALLKARHAAAAAHLPALADDSGLEVDALGGRPGVRSARYAGEGASDAHNNAKLLAELAGIPDSGRGARYRCVIAFVRNSEDPAPLLSQGSWEGRIALAPRGSGGFGYDSLFIPRGQSITAAQMSAQDKNSVSHRGLALAQLLREFAAR
jgi:XTP/dITP diphosphohydrolase